MRRAVAFVVMLVWCTFSAAAQNTPKAGTSTGPTTTEARPAATMSDADIEAMRADLARMRTLVGQMQRNLGFVDSGLTPLKHQFELEIEMWNLLINDMQRRLNAQSGRMQPAANAPTRPPQ